MPCLLAGMTLVLSAAACRRCEVPHCPETLPALHGIDISHHNTITAWDSLDVDFIFVKATEGADWVDVSFQANLDSARKHGIPVGAYHFLTTTSPAADQFASYSAMVPRDSVDLRPVLDVECMTKGHRMGRKAFVAHVGQWISLCQSHYGIKPILYSSRRFYRLHLKRDFDGCPFWCGDINAGPAYVDAENWLLWQYAIEKLDGSAGKVDRDMLRPGKTLEDLRM